MATAITSKVMPPINLMAWVEKHRADLKPPVGNKYLYRGTDFFVMVIGGPNARNDFHLTQSEEYFYQVKGAIVVRIREDNKIKDYVVREGETFFIPPNTPHAPCRPAGTIGVVVERVRPPDEMEHQIFYCEKCGDVVEDNEFACKDIVDHFRQAMEEVWSDPERGTCKNCGTRVERAKPFEMKPEHLAQI